jgi:RNA polymerase sigma-70 factor (ECF subfamily)
MKGSKEDYKLVRCIVNGHPKDFMILVKKYKMLVSHIIFRLVSDPAEKDDLGQEIFIKIYQALPNYEFRSNLATWISKISYNHCLNYLRTKKSQITTEIDDQRHIPEIGKAKNNKENTSAKGDLPDEILIKNEIYCFLNKAINDLPIKFRKIITFFYLDNMSHAEISAIMDLPIGSVKGYLFRARKQLKDKLLENYDMEDIWP